MESTDGVASRNGRRGGSVSCFVIVHVPRGSTLLNHSVITEHCSPFQTVVERLTRERDNNILYYQKHSLE